MTPGMYYGFGDENHKSPYYSKIGEENKVYGEVHVSACGEVELLLIEEDES